MNLALHGFLLQVFVSILNFHHGRLLCSAGEPGYLDFDNLPETNFSCQGKVIGGYYADVEAGCQMFHVCTIGQKDEIMDIKFLCLNGTVFDQETRVCERVDEVDCSKSERFYNLNLELYGNNAVTLSLHENDDDDDDDLSDSVEDHQLRTTSARPSTTSTTSTTTSRPGKLSTTAASGAFQHPAGYPQHYQPQPPFPQVHTSQSKSLYDDKNGGYHHQYIFHNGERANDQATSYQLFSNQGVSSTTVPPQPQIHQIRFSSTASPQIIHNEPSTVTPLFHATSSTIQTLLNSNANSPALINPIFHNHGIASTTEQFTVHSNNPRETSDYRDEDDHEQSVRPLEALRSTNKGKVSKLSISPVPGQQGSTRTAQTKASQTSQQQRISSNFLPTPATVQTTVRSFYPTPRPSPKPSQSQSQSVTHHVTHQVTQHIHVSPGVTIPRLKPHQITINLPPPDIQRIVQSPPPLLPSQSRVIVTAKASVSDESGRPLNSTQLVTLPLPTIPASYDDYKEGDESFDPFYRDVPKIRKNRRIRTSRVENARLSRRRRSLDETYRYVYEADNPQEGDLKATVETRENGNNAMNEENTRAKITVEDFQAIKESLIKFRDILFSGEVDEESVRGVAEIIAGSAERAKVGNEAFNVAPAKQAEDNAIKRSRSLEDLMTEASKHLSLAKEEEEEEKEEEEEDAGETEEEEDEEANHEDSNVEANTERMINEHIEDVPTATPASELQINIQSTTARSEQNESREGVIDVIILDSDSDVKARPTSSDFDVVVDIARTDAPIEIIIEEETKSGSRDVSGTNEKIISSVQVAGYLTKDESRKRPSSATSEEERRPEIPQEAVRRRASMDSRERKSGSRRKGSRSRPSRRRISSKVKQQKTDYVAASVAIPREEETGETTAITTAATTTTMTTTPTTTTPTTTTTMPTTTTTTTTTAAETTITVSTTTIPSITPFEEKPAEKTIDSHLFDEPESQTSKEVDTRAIGEYDTSYSKSLLDSKNHDASKSKEMERSFDHQIRKEHAENVEQPDDELEEERETESADRIQTTSSEDTNFTENSQNAEEAITQEVTKEVTQEVYEERQSSEETFTEYDGLDDEFNARTSGEELEESSEEPNKISLSQEALFPDKANSDQVEPSYREDENDKSSVLPGDSNEEGRSTMKSSEEVGPEEWNEYQDTTEPTAENTRDVSAQEDYRESESTEDSTTPVEYTSSDEYTDSQEDAAGSTGEVESSTEGVLKFTDELPRSDHTEYVETEEASESEENDEHDYVDDNYEPENYKQPDPVSKPDSGEKKSEERDEKINEDTTTKDPGREESIDAHRTNESTEAKAQTEHAEGVTEIVDLEEIANSTATFSTTTATTSFTTTATTSSTTTATTSSTTTTTTSTTTSRPTTTTPRPTPPKLFKPISSRRTYAFIPPTTTPNPVVIKPRLGLYNPKPAKPPKSYNDLAPKPVIRKLPLLLRKSTTTVAATIADDLNAGSRETTTEPTTTTMTTTTTTTTTTMTTATPTTITTPIATTIATTTTTTTPMPTTESSRSEENALEDKLEARDHEITSLDLPAKGDTVDKEDQLSSPSEQDSPANSSRDTDSRILDKEILSFTPYPISRLSSLASSVEQTTKEAQIKREEESVDIDIATRAILPTTLTPQRSEYVDTSTGEDHEETGTTASTTETATTAKSHHQDVIAPLVIISERPATISSSTTVPTTTTTEDVDVRTTSTDATIFRPVNRKTTGGRKHASFNCLEKEMYRFYGDARDCRLFHYCSPGFTARQVLDFRFVCEEGTAFDEETQSCRHEVRNRKCRNRSW